MQSLPHYFLIVFLSILDALSTKTKKKRKIPINGFLKKTLSKIKIQNRDKVHIFLSGNGTVYKSQDSLNRIWRKTLEKAKIENLRFHDLRHTAATRMVERCGNIVAVSKILGHANISTTMRYCHPDKSLEDALESLVDEKVLAILLATGKKGNMQERKSP